MRTRGSLTREERERARIRGSPVCAWSIAANRVSRRPPSDPITSRHADSIARGKSSFVCARAAHSSDVQIRCLQWSVAKRGTRPMKSDGPTLCTYHTLTSRSTTSNWRFVHSSEHATHGLHEGVLRKHDCPAGHMAECIRCASFCKRRRRPTANFVTRSTSVQMLTHALVRAHASICIVRQQKDIQRELTRPETVAIQALGRRTAT